MGVWLILCATELTCALAQSERFQVLLVSSYLAHFCGILYRDFILLSSGLYSSRFTHLLHSLHAMGSMQYPLYCRTLYNGDRIFRCKILYLFCKLYWYRTEFRRNIIGNGVCIYLNTWLAVTAYCRNANKRTGKCLHELWRCEACEYKLYKSDDELFQQTLDRWRIIFYIVAFINIIGFLLFITFASGEVQPWNEHKKDNEPKEDDQLSERTECVDTVATTISKL